MFSMASVVYEKLLGYARRPGYTMTQEHGQRIYQYVDTKITPPKGSEIFVGKLPKNLFEDELIPVLEKIGPIYKLRLMLDFSGYSRGFAFVTFFKPEVASMAVSVLQNYPIRPGKNLGVYKSLDNCRLFVGGLPTQITKDQLLKEICIFVDGIKQIIMYPSHKDKKLNRGFAFLEFESHRLAAIARRKLSPGSVNIFGQDIMVDWADPIPDPDPQIMAQVTKLYIRNLPLQMTHQDLWNILHGYLKITFISKVHKHNDYAFVHFITRASAEEALKKLNGVSFWGQQIEVAWARPKIYSKEYRLNATPDNFCLSLPPKMRKKVVEINSQHRKNRTFSADGTIISPNKNKVDKLNNNAKIMATSTPLSKMSHYICECFQCSDDDYFNNIILANIDSILN